MKYFWSTNTTGINTTVREGQKQGLRKKVNMQVVQQASNLSQGKDNTPVKNEHA